MTEHEQLRIFVAVWIDNRDMPMIDIIALLELYLSPSELTKIGNDLSLSRAYGDARMLRHDKVVHNPFVTDTTNWWYWYAGRHSR